MYREVSLKGNISIELMNLISETFGNKEDIKVTIKITNEDFGTCEGECEKIILNGKNSSLIVYPDEDQLKRGRE